MPETPETPRARYDDIAEWYDRHVGGSPSRDRVLTEFLGDGRGWCLDVGCGTGQGLVVIGATGRRPVGLELSARQLRLAAERCDALVQGSAERLPFRSGVFPTVTSSWVSTDVDDFAAMMREIGRVLAPGGTFFFHGVHPCFNGPQVETLDDGSRLVHPTYRDARRHTASPWWGPDGIRTRVGGMRHVPLAEFLNAIVGAPLQITRVAEPGPEAVPHSLVVLATKARTLDGMRPSQK
jgi:ubiquinone/menaquinone biosynthesis C-methylase UbiE